MTAQARPNFDAQDVTIACAVSMLAQLVFVLAFSLPSPKLVEADISNANAQPIAVAITPVLKLGTQSPTKLPSQWQRRKPPPPPKTQAPVPSPLAEKTPPLTLKTPVADAAPPPPLASAAPAETTPPPVEDAKAPTTVASAEGSEQGAASGTEPDPLKAAAVDRYKAALASWFSARFHCPEGVSPDKLKKLAAVVSVAVTADRKIGSYAIGKASGDSTFDAAVQATLEQIQSSGVELPAPPENYPDLLGKRQQFRLYCH